MNLENFNIGKKDYKYIAILFIFSAVLVGYYVLFNIDFGIFCSDVYIYLANSLTFSGVNLNHLETIYLGPVVCFATSLLFDVGFRSEASLFIVTGIFAIIGNIGLYILLRTRFNEIQSIAGTVIYSCLSLNVLWLANGTLDIPAVAITIWIVIFTLIAINKNPKYYPVAFAAFIVGFMIRYTVGFILPILFVYFIYKTHLKLDKQSKRYIKLCIIACVIIILGFIGILYFLDPGNMKFLEIIFNATQGSKGAEADPAYTLDTWFYLKNFLQFISCDYTQFEGIVPNLRSASPLAYGVLAIFLIGVGLSLNKIKQIKIKNKKLAVVALVLAIFICATFTYIIGLVSIILTMVLVIMLHYLIRDSGFENLDLNFLFLIWFLVYFMYFTYFNTKVDRYMIPLMPAVVYFIMCAVNKIELKTNIKNVLPIILIALFIVNAFAFTSTIDCDTDLHKNKHVADYIKQIEPNYHDLTIGSANQRPFLWYFAQPIAPISINNPEEIDQSNIDYYIATREIDLNNFTLIKECENMYIYKHI